MKHRKEPRQCASCLSTGLWLLPEDGVRGVATSPLTLNAAICCIWAAAMAAMGFRYEPCVAAISAACCCIICCKGGQRKEREEGGEWVFMVEASNTAHPKRRWFLRLSATPTQSLLPPSQPTASSSTVAAAAWLSLYWQAARRAGERNRAVQRLRLLCTRSSI